MKQILHFANLLAFIFTTTSLYAQSAPEGSPFVNVESAESVKKLFSQSRSGMPKKILLIQPSNSTYNGLLTSWSAAVVSSGDSAVQRAMSVLDSLTALQQFDVMIYTEGVSSGQLTTSRKNNILSFLRSGRPLYLQGEYQTIYETNIFFKQIVDSLGGAFVWGETTQGDQQPVRVLGSLAQTPDTISTLAYHWWGVNGTPDSNRVQTFLRSAQGNLAFIYKANANTGVVVHSTDQDWVIQLTQSGGAQLLKNILYHLKNNLTLSTPQSPIQSRNLLSPKLEQNYPNPFNPTTTIRYQLAKSGNVNLSIYDVLGRKVATLVNERQSAGEKSVLFDASQFASGIYFYAIQADDFRQTRKMILMK